MNRPITVRINMDKVQKDHLYVGRKGTYLNLVIWEMADGLDQFGNTHSVQQDVGKDLRDAGMQNPFIGSAKVPASSDSTKEGLAAMKAAAIAPPDEENEDPFSESGNSNEAVPG